MKYLSQQAFNAQNSSPVIETNQLQSIFHRYILMYIDAWVNDMAINIKVPLIDYYIIYVMFETNYHKAAHHQSTTIEHLKY